MKLHDIESDADKLLYSLGINSSTPYFKHAFAEIVTITRMQRQIPLHIYSTVMEDGVAMAISNDRYLYITKDEIHIKDNGDGVIFKYPGLPWIFNPDAQPIDIWHHPQGKYIDSFIAGLLAGQRVPIALINGEKETGKTTLAKSILAVINGKLSDVLPIPKSNDDLKVVLDGNKMVCFDNLESAPIFFHDTICMAVTGSTDKKRKLFKDKNIIELRLQNAIIITSIDPASMIRDDVVSRMIVITTDKISNFIGESSIIESRMNQRDNYLSWLVKVIQQSLSRPISTKHRMTGWATIAETIGLNNDDFKKINDIGNELIASSIPALLVMKDYLSDQWPKSTTGIELYDHIRDYLRHKREMTKFPESWRELAVIIRRHEDLFQSEIGLSLKSSGKNVTLQWGSPPHEASLARVPNPRDTSEI